MCCKLEPKILNNWKTTASLWNHRKCRVCSNSFICTTQQYSFFLVLFQQSFAWNLKNISPIVWYCCNIWRPYKISNILYKTKEKAVSFLSPTSGTSHDLSWMTSFSRPHGIFVWKHQKVCCSLLQWSDVHTWIWCRTCTVRFFRSLLRIFASFPPIWVCEMKVLWKVASSRAEDLKPVFFILSWVQREEFYFDKAISCKSYKLHQKRVSYKCMLFVDCLVVSQEYFVNWATVTKLRGEGGGGFGSNFHPESYVRCHVCHTTVVVTWRKTLNF